ncbi:hypothetical protein NEOLEDRAFT_1184036 [Neolentinus lepideus HHB14362 ss-1]|uniref:Uncharacterized protein n=1 Tax=Neolentinus lepideus HHB14362 ss-1 TaxID=1314782 RepID=A0A165MSR9_9AGAM|nr:hypothetical protein NEOLEDRAFT_1184036 [Neolentinus lepideus HHB14362 ss-1]
MPTARSGHSSRTRFRHPKPLKLRLYPHRRRGAVPPAPHTAQASRKPVSKGKGRAVDTSRSTRHAVAKSKQSMTTKGARVLAPVPEHSQESGDEDSEPQMVPIVTPLGERMVPLLKSRRKDGSSKVPPRRIGALVPVVELPTRTKVIPASSTAAKPRPKPRAAYGAHRHGPAADQNPFDAASTSHNAFAESSQAASSMLSMAPPPRHLHDDSELTLGSGAVGSGGATGSGDLYGGLAGMPPASGDPGMIQVPAHLWRMFMSSMNASSGSGPNPSHQMGSQGMQAPALIDHLSYGTNNSEIQQFGARGSPELGGLSHASRGGSSKTGNPFGNPSYLSRR